MYNVRLLVSLCFTCAALALSDAAERPNIIFILTDDQSYGLMGCDGNTITQTPNIDRLASEGTFFDYAHVTSAICTPSRISILLSQYERKHGVNFNSGTSVSPEAWAMSYPVALRESGYYTGYVGKNHSPIGEGGYGSGLMEESFDYWYSGHGHLSFYPKSRHKIFKGAKSDTQLEIIEEGVEDFLSNEHRMEGALRFIDSRPTDKPFCLSICLNLPHDSSSGTMKMLESDDEIYRTLYRDKEIPLPEGYVAKQDIKTPKLPADLLKVEERQDGYSYVDTPETLVERLTRHLQAVTGIDRLVGNLRDELAKSGLAENTVIVFSSDHGLFMGEQGLGGKSLCYEKTTHVPFIVFDPALDDSLRGRRLGSMVQSIDVGPTLLDYAGVEAPEAFQGKSLRGIVEGSVEEVRDYVYSENMWSTQFGNPRCEAVQDRQWKYIRYYKNENFPASLKIKAAKELGIPLKDILYSVHDSDIPLYRHFAESSINGEEPVFEELYNLKDDPTELNNVVGDPAYSAHLKRLREAWKKEILVARGEGTPKVLRYTRDSMLESNRPVVHE